ncbi:MAG TPA: hypothetical protein VHP58_07175 [Alphaproteobacteria bacterium]|nr:hypothetical protein [Alphaproteobacteria bacterium]
MPLLVTLRATIMSTEESNKKNEDQLTNAGIKIVESRFKNEVWSVDVKVPDAVDALKALIYFIAQEGGFLEVGKYKNI